jgi:hypothetical protein
MQLYRLFGFLLPSTAATEKQPLTQNIFKIDVREWWIFMVGLQQSPPAVLSSVVRGEGLGQVVVLGCG